ncbi:50S ribosomal protein L15 [Candidatus Daviesbacteria bacterium RIFCSPHIGHO2_12_FULL_37_11]|uniref:Large ribosomal subunit protein uL15 n=1 Tax=Candidatus Daviesbacteria bacterium RIFCSPHIGHO2_12_FULL_37_11 TaxID=1797777 RepID=A0A1F5KCF9_9BACT|nr:MAG: 50S ribosomal protein L15 [Candidatus Daviesbacteria bacterium GWA1_38_6]OGE16454.1 MAG: 50S ribosomal protein L15 [Candidatus Daviesbacteria bacterium RIFCSPHIGHO2_01_FULL_37_27]OGE38549.1 MAG: 50S ribosomal protein L15 [Candidatus Daviesbacteria bacterium RIFCSPHIGHO2_12_FULL_37_11]OGE46144.1 MAG: 50S ribosomal protein L15 [Candidatus Daviesbacteria bacterium RIFCSPLOWO2_01_FULL_37_10]
MKLNALIKVKFKSKKRVGRGLGSGRGKTAGRGSKGQKARGKIPPSFIGGTLPLYKKLPRRKGMGNSKGLSNPKVVTLSSLNKFSAKTVIDLEKLLEEKIISKRDFKNGVKILGNGEIKKPLIIKLPISNKAKGIIEGAGGEVE